MEVLILLDFSMVSRVWKRREMLFGVDLSKNFGKSSVLDLFGGESDVLKILTTICATSARGNQNRTFEFLQPEGCKN